MTTNLIAQEHILINVNGSCYRNSGPGGYAATLRRFSANGASSYSLTITCCEPQDTTDMQMELTAISEALERVEARETALIIVRTNKQIIFKAMDEWVHKWKANGWRKPDRKPVKNRNLWERILKACEDKLVRFEWVPVNTIDVYIQEVISSARMQTDTAREMRGLI